MIGKHVGFHRNERGQVWIETCLWSALLAAVFLAGWLSFRVERQLYLNTLQAHVRALR